MDSYIQISITIINAAIMTWLGVNQYKLQKRQTQAQEYEIYKRLYLLLSNANREIDGFLDSLVRALWRPTYVSDNEFLKHKQQAIDKLVEDLRESYVDYELKLSKDTFNKNGYLNILDLMSGVLQCTKISLEKDEAQLSPNVIDIYSIGGSMDEGQIQHICSHFKKGLVSSSLYQNLERFVELKKCVRCDDSLLESIRAKCKIN